MSGSSHASHTYSRCIVHLDAGISISWAADPDGSYEHGQRHHQEEEDGFLARLVHATAPLEVLFDELEEEGRVFTAPTEPAFGKTNQRGAHGMVQMCEVELACTPALSELELAALAERISKLLVEAPEASPPLEPEPDPEPEPEPEPVPARPWWKFWSP
jgi:hypothetical protein